MTRVTLFAETGDAPSMEATMQRISDGAGLVPVGADLATPIGASVQDGPRIMGMSNFGGKKAAPFKKGGGRKTKAVVAKAALAGAKASKKG